MVINGNSSGTSTVYVSNLGNVGVDYSKSNGILLINVKGSSNANFVQSGRIVAGTYDYYLTRGNAAYGSSAKDWYLNNRKPTTATTAKSSADTFTNTALDNNESSSSTLTDIAPVTNAVLAASSPKIIRPEAASYNSTAYAANNMFKLGLQDRLNGYAASEYETEGGGLDGSPERGSAWINYVGSKADFKDGSGQLDSDMDKNTVMIGADMVVHSTNEQNKVTVGLMGGYGRAKGSTHNNLSGHNSRHETDGYGIGVYGSYQQNANEESGLYADSWILWNDFDNEVNGDGLPKVKYDSKGITAAVELGYNWKIAEKNNVRYVLQPHAQLMYQNVQADDFTEANGTKVRFDDGSGLQTKVGLRASAHIQTSEQTAITPYVEANWVHNNKDYRVYMNDVASDLEHKGGAGELKLGIQGDITRNLSVKAEANYLGGSNDYKEVGGSVGVKYRF
ncbi:autotransporter outer membrane beta-barrel domain-containing protein [Vitreoscilla massiliensis]|uniref:Autotransporter outer membrane beta-barrel domain-containing protein n=2 Tax=Vitreoscilla massiliensis TaxID=1689272 RepID=A0ABY4DWY1_9NEIS|nr:autotransporter outer membrane beta-barrel domain-containing protein [Vitreoscilla massiliensis]UOO87779.1 autotransporter outer membrane beta-barrel domain-containing protein [Vitreoscilla massiliensis]